MEKNDTSTGQDTASLDWNKVMQEYWLSLSKTWSGVFQTLETEMPGQFNKGRGAELMQETVRMWQAIMGGMGEPLAFERFPKAAEMTPDIVLGFTQTCLQSFISLQARAGEWGQKRASSLSADEIQQLDRELIRDLTETYEKEFSKYLKVPQVGLGRFHQERSLQAVDKYNSFQLVLLEFLHMLYLPVEKSLKSLQGEMAETTEAGASDEKSKNYYNLWIKLLEGEYMELFQQPGYADAMGKTLCALNEFVEARQAVVNDVLKQLNVPTNQDMDELSKEIYLLKKRVRALENR